MKYIKIIKTYNVNNYIYITSDQKERLKHFMSNIPPLKIKPSNR